jgi:hypothetical protein
MSMATHISIEGRILNASQKMASLEFLIIEYYEYTVKLEDMLHHEKTPYYHPRR